MAGCNFFASSTLWGSMIVFIWSRLFSPLCQQMERAGTDALLHCMIFKLVYYTLQIGKFYSQPYRFESGTDSQEPGRGAT